MENEKWRIWAPHWIFFHFFFKNGLVDIRWSLPVKKIKSIFGFAQKYNFWVLGKIIPLIWIFVWIFWKNNFKTSQWLQWLLIFKSISCFRGVMSHIPEPACSIVLVNYWFPASEIYFLTPFIFLYPRYHFCPIYIPHIPRIYSYTIHTKYIRGIYSYIQNPGYIRRI